MLAAPLLIGLATAATGQQKAAIPVIAMFLAAGAWVLGGVNAAEQRPNAGTPVRP